MSPTTTDILNALRKALEAERVECSKCHGFGRKAPLRLICPPECVSGMVPDPAYGPLLALFKRECQRPVEPLTDYHGPIHYSVSGPCICDKSTTHMGLRDYLHSACDGSGYFTDTHWLTEPDGALDGAIVFALGNTPIESKYLRLSYADRIAGTLTNIRAALVLIWVLNAAT